MQLAYSSNAFTRTDLNSALRAISALGYSGVEILCDHPHWFPGRVNVHEVREVSALLDHLGLSVSNLNANTANGYFDPVPAENLFEPSLSSANREFREWRVNYSIATIELAQQLGAKCISVTSGHPGSGGTPEQGMAYFVESLKRICDAATKHQVQVGIEYEPGLLVERATELAEVFHRVDSPLLGANLDIGHSWLDGESPEQALDLLRGRIWNVHVEDIRGRKHYHLIPGEGELPFERYFKLLREQAYDNFLTVELYTCVAHPVAAGRAALAHLQSVFDRLDYHTERQGPRDEG
ncbi:MAG: sugar phosphate isomerase/epimerase [Gammaproteobacteria bacterium]|nr:sugar phosphate isomerase/epimerase [Gammaproteobacteria bacterium]MCP5417611.1 sugar phosphate isomerase/epimerase [Chromatiaceae bacterium]